MTAAVLFVMEKNGHNSNVQQEKKTSFAILTKSYKLNADVLTIALYSNED